MKAWETMRDGLVNCREEDWRSTSAALRLSANPIRIDKFIDELAEYAAEQIRGTRVLDNAVAVISNLADYGLVWALIGVTRAVTSRRLRQKSIRAVLFTATASPVLNWSLKFIVRRPRPYQSGQSGYSSTWYQPCNRDQHPDHNIDSALPFKGDSQPRGTTNKTTDHNDNYRQYVGESFPLSIYHDLTGHLSSRTNSDRQNTRIHHTLTEALTEAMTGHLSRLTSFETRTPQSPSFPSGHSLTAWCAATTLAADDPLGPIYYLLAIAISYSRLHLGHHYATDIIGGAVLGIALGKIGQKWIQGY